MMSPIASMHSYLARPAAVVQTAQEAQLVGMFSGIGPFLVGNNIGVDFGCTKP